MTRALTFITMMAIAFVTAGDAAANVAANTKWLNTNLLNSPWIRTADLNASNGGPSFHTATGQPLSGVYLNGTTFVSANGASGDDFIGAWTTAIRGDGTPTLTYIDDRKYPPNAGGTFLYRVSFQEPNGHRRDLCPDGNPGWAIPLAGEWDYVTGARISYGGNTFTWACTTGALGKCAASGILNTLGYEPWTTDPYYQPIQAPSGVLYWLTIDGKRTHQACTRMIRADYCGDGISHTTVGNQIDVRDFLLNGQQLAMPSQWAAEALWDENGAIWISCDRQGYIVAGQNICSNNHDLVTDRCFPIYELPTPEQVLPISPHLSDGTACAVTDVPISDDEFQACGVLSRLPVLLGNLTANLQAGSVSADQGGDQALP